MHSGLFAILILAALHLLANKIKLMGWLWHGRCLSFAAGISFAYVFVELLPSLEKGHFVLKQAFDPFIPYLDRHTYVVALLGMLFYYGLHAQTENGNERNFWLVMSGYLLFNFFVGASLSDPTNPEIQPLILFTIAMSLHYLVCDYHIEISDPVLFTRWGRWVLILALLLGYAVGYFLHIPDALIALAVSFIAGGILLNTMKYELPKKEKGTYPYFVTGALLYTALLLALK